MIAASNVAGKALAVSENLLTQRVIGYTRSKTYTRGKKNPKLIQENFNVGVQAWEIGIVLAGIAAYEFINGAGSLIGNLAGITSTPQGYAVTPQQAITDYMNVLKGVEMIP